MHIIKSEWSCVRVYAHDNGCAYRLRVRMWRLPESSMIARCYGASVSKSDTVRVCRSDHSTAERERIGGMIRAIILLVLMVLLLLRQMLRLFRLVLFCRAMAS